MGKIVFKSVRILDEKATGIEKVGRQGYISRTTSTYDMSGVRTHVFRSTHVERLKRPSTWAFTVFVGIVIGAILMIVRWPLGPITPFRALISVLPGLGLAYL